TERELCPADLEAPFGPGLVSSRGESDRQPRLAPVRRRDALPADELGLPGLARSHGRNADVPGCEDLPVERRLPARLEPAQVAPRLPVADLDPAPLDRSARRSHDRRRRDLPVLPEGGLRAAVGPDHAVDAEVPVVW